MPGRAVFPQIQIEVIVGRVHAQLLNASFQDVIVVLSLGAADDFTNAGNQTVHSSHGLSVGVQLHVEGLDILGIIGDEDRLLEHHLGEVTLMLRLQIAAPVDGVLKLVVVLLQQGYSLGVGDAAEVVVQHIVQPVKQTLVQILIEEFHLLGSVLQHIGDDVFDHIFSQTHIVRQIRKGDFRLDHPEFGSVPGGVGVLCPEGGAEGVDIPEGHGKGLTVELTGNRQVGGLTIEVLREVHLAVLGLGDIVQIQSGDLEHLTCTLTVGAGDQGRMDIHKVPLLEELVDSHGCQAANPKYSLEGVGSGTKMGDGAQELHAVTLGLQGEIAGGGTLYGDLLGLNLKGLLGIGGQHQRARMIRAAPMLILEIS